MNKPLVFGVAAAVLAGGVSFWATRHLGCSRPAGVPSAGMGNVFHLKDELRLDERQTAAISILDRELAGQLAGYCGEYCAARAELGAALMREETVATNGCQPMVDRMCAVQAESEQATLEHIRKVCALLTPEQRKQFVAGLVKCLCGAGAGGACGGSCMKGPP
jgi:hypothetical protein